MRRHRPSLWSNTFFSFAAALLCGAACVIALSALFSALEYFVIGGMQFIRFFSLTALTAGTFFSGRICGKYRRRRGLIDGLICGLLMYAALTAAAVITTGAAADIKKLLLLALAGAAGGVAGVNSKRPRNFME